ncbi:MAG: hypothetical protein KatS3mg032_0160 [Cyclobacteriaceae bacterium]|nr:MAG: hypothetical protein KatS3mg032_0160 [Cyclobacteriaceae bacterium]
MYKRLVLLLLIIAAASCRATGNRYTTVVKPRYHHSLYKNHVHKRKWQFWRIKIEPEKQGVRKVKMRS